ncbi:MAG: trypsin-like peptidase domain-containing protein [Alteromonadaceae bacterium]|nr:trypsin-like peptidase domain-containing protein [Alteromonadaceae bacterium]
MKKTLTLFLLFHYFLGFNVFANLADTVEKIKPSVVGIGVYTPTGRPKNTLHGSGFVIGNGQYVVTNDHVIGKDLDETLLQKRAVFIGSGKSSKVRLAEVVARSDMYDLAVLKIEGAPLPALALATDKFEREGTYVAFTGFPIGSVLGLYPVTHRGIVASITPTIIPVSDSRQISIKMLKRLRDPYLVYQLDATAYPGNSGSGLYNLETGEVIGVINKVFVQATKEAVISNPSGITYAIPVKYLRELLDDNQISY